MGLIKNGVEMNDTTTNNNNNTSNNNRIYLNSVEWPIIVPFSFPQSILIYNCK